MGKARLGQEPRRPRQPRGLRISCLFPSLLFLVLLLLALAFFLFIFPPTPSCSRFLELDLLIVAAGGLLVCSSLLRILHSKSVSLVYPYAGLTRILPAIEGNLLLLSFSFNCIVVIRLSGARTHSDLLLFEFGSLST